jgi:hypothetical protein
MHSPLPQWNWDAEHGGTHTPLTHAPLSQSAGRLQLRPSAHFDGQVPPQSTSPSLPSFT